MPPRLLQSIIGGIIGSLVGSSIVVCYISHIQRQNTVSMERINQNLKRMDSALEGFNFFAGDLVNTLDKLASGGDVEDEIVQQG
ncbi:hypothetical protein TWF481_002439 [Arthrobotrys musiformis]|uniref:Uncharacterized protein n=1 Tax=Arthrobotrys musiformis TaxID=47236 RepID=A0AAV9VZA5_9PEZI